MNNLNCTKHYEYYLIFKLSPQFYYSVYIICSCAYSVLSIFATFVYSNYKIVYFRYLLLRFWLGSIDFISVNILIDLIEKQNNIINYKNSINCGSILRLISGLLICICKSKLPFNLLWIVPNPIYGTFVRLRVFSCIESPSLSFKVSSMKRKSLNLLLRPSWTIRLKQNWPLSTKMFKWGIRKSNNIVLLLYIMLS